MWLICGVASKALRGRQRNGDRIDVAVGAFDSSVGTAQRKLRVLCMIETDIRPEADAMTFGAIVAVDAVMCIVVLVTGIAVGGQGDFEFVASVAGIAFDAGVSARQSETRPLQVIEKTIRPLRALMAVFAFAAIAAHVAVVLRVTSEAVGRGIDVIFRNVAADTVE